MAKTQEIVLKPAGPTAKKRAQAEMIKRDRLVRGKQLEVMPDSRSKEQQAAFMDFRFSRVPADPDTSPDNEIADRLFDFAPAKPPWRLGHAIGGISGKGDIHRKLSRSQTPQPALAADTIDRFHASL